MCYKFLPCCGNDQQLGVPVRRWLYYSVIFYWIYAVISFVSSVICYLDYGFAGLFTNRLNTHYNAILMVDIFNIIFTAYFLHRNYFSSGANIIGTNIGTGALNVCFEGFMIFQHIITHVKIILTVLILEVRWQNLTYKSFSGGCNWSEFVHWLGDFFYVFMIIWLWFAFNNKIR